MLLFLVKAGAGDTRKNKAYLEKGDNDWKTLLLNMNLKVIIQKARTVASKKSGFTTYSCPELA